jgi:hypothetical protein
MATVSERSKEILEKLRGVFKDPTLAADMTLESATAYCDEKYSAIIEQALLAERRLAKLEDAEMCDEEAATVDHVARCVSDSAAYLGTGERLKIAAFKYMGSVLRAAAEKEAV